MPTHNSTHSIASPGRTAAIAAAAIALVACAPDESQTGGERRQLDQLLELGRVYLQQQRNDDALEIFRKAVALDSLGARGHFGLGYTYLQLKFFAEAEAAYRRGIRLDSTDVPARHNLAIACLEQGRYDDAIEQLQKALLLDPSDAGAHRSLAFIYSQQHRFEAAEQALQAALRIDPENAGSRRNLGALYRDQGRYGLAEAELLSAIGLDSLDRGSWNELWNTYIESRQVDRAVAVLETAIRLDSTHAEAHRGLGELLELVGRSGEAGDHRDRFEHLTRLEEQAATLRTGIAERPDHLEARLALGEILERMGRSQEALDAYAAVVERDPHKVEPLEKMARLHLNRGNLKQAAGMARRVIALDTEPDIAARAYSVLGPALAQSGQLEQAARALRDGLARVPGSAELHYNLGKVLTLQGGSSRGRGGVPISPWDRSRDGLCASRPRHRPDAPEEAPQGHPPL